MATILRLGRDPALKAAIEALSKGPPLDPGIDSDRDRQWKLLLEATDQALREPSGQEYLRSHPDLSEELRRHFLAIDQRQIADRSTQTSGTGAVSIFLRLRGFRDKVAAAEVLFGGSDTASDSKQKPSGQGKTPPSNFMGTVVELCAPDQRFQQEG